MDDLRSPAFLGSRHQLLKDHPRAQHAEGTRSLWAPPFRVLLPIAGG